MKHRRLKVAATRPKSELTTIHDRQATELPAGALIAVGTRDDPYERGGRISVALSLRGDPLLALHVPRNDRGLPICSWSTVAKVL